jgi:hypothetical protein
MSDVLSLQEKIDLARTVSDVAVEELDEFCAERGLPLQDVTAWSTAFETGGKLGVQAMVVHSHADRRQIRAWHEGVKSAVKRFRPRRIRVKADGNHFTAEEVKPLTATNVVHTPIFQLRVVSDGEAEHWFLYWRRADGTWWPYAGRPSFASIDDAVAEVQSDSHHCFRLHPLH